MFQIARSASLLRNFKNANVLNVAKRFAPYQAIALNSFNLPKYNFSSAAEDKEPESHDDFKPKAKVQLNDENVYDQIDQWVKGNKCVLFMKGVPQMPQCGFSRFVVEVLKFYKVNDFKSIDILQDPVLREAVKKYSEWNTYPQLYVNGKLVGGADIVNDMHKEGSLKTLFQENGLIAGSQ